MNSTAVKGACYGWKGKLVSSRKVAKSFITPGADYIWLVCWAVCEFFKSEMRHQGAVQDLSYITAAADADVALKKLLTWTIKNAINLITKTVLIVDFNKSGLMQLIDNPNLKHVIKTNTSEVIRALHMGYSFVFSSNFRDVNGWLLLFFSGLFINSSIWKWFNVQENKRKKRYWNFLQSSLSWSWEDVWLLNEYSVDINASHYPDFKAYVRCHTLARPFSTVA